MPIRITGLTSGLDTESIISALVSSYNYKTNKYKRHRQIILEAGCVENTEYEDLQSLQQRRQHEIIYRI